jgi:predicted metal-dependent enzyme (double-stranded beta helix superfamily)
MGLKENPENMQESAIIVTIQGGCVYAVDNVPSDRTVEVHDYDIEGTDETFDNIHTDDDGEKYILSNY